MHSPPPLPPDARFNELQFFVAGAVSRFPKAEVALKEAIVSQGSWGWRAAECGAAWDSLCAGSTFVLLKDAGRELGWDSVREKPILTINYWLLCSVQRVRPSHQQMVNSAGEGGQSRHKAWA